MILSISQLAVILSVMGYRSLLPKLFGKPSKPMTDIVREFEKVLPYLFTTRISYVFIFPAIVIKVPLFRELVNMYNS